VTSVCRCRPQLRSCREVQGENLSSLVGTEDHAIGYNGRSDPAIGEMPFRYQGRLICRVQRIYETGDAMCTWGNDPMGAVWSGVQRNLGERLASLGQQGIREIASGETRTTMAVQIIRIEQPHLGVFSTH